MIRLYRAPWSTNCERVGLALGHKGVEVESVVIDYADRSAVERVSGQGLVPVIEDEGEVVVDSMEIVRHLERRFPSPPLYPAEEPRLTEMLLFIDWFNQVWKGPPNSIEEELEGPRPDGDRIAAWGSEMDAALDRFEALLSGRDYLLGTGLSAADCAAFPFLKYARGREAEDDELFHRILDEHQTVGGRPRLREWIERVDALPRAY